MKLTRINDSTAKDDKRVFFRTIYKTPHYTFPTCPKCKKTVNIVWVAWPDRSVWMCDDCIEWSENVVSQEASSN
jgi:hypothetical protein